MRGGRFGPLLTPDGATFRLWAPAAQSVDVIVDGDSRAMQSSEEGWFTAHIAGAASGSRYRFLIDGEVDIPDPASAFQPGDIDGPSQLVDHTAFAWRSEQWRGRPWHETVLLECHLGTFTPSGTCKSAIEKLDHLVDTGITALELMPLGDFPGRYNWGYDGVLWCAPDHSYGTPDDLKTLIDEAHSRGIMMFLDVVYNHFGPQGNYLGRYAPQFFRKSETPWGMAIDYTSPEVKAFAVENALHWLGNYRFDGLRLDAVHAIAEPGGLTMLEELSQAAGLLAKETNRHIHLVLENDDNRVSVLDPRTNPPVGRYRAQWNDDYHHAWHAVLTDEAHGYYADYAPKARKLVARTLGSGFAYQGEPSAHRGGTPRGEPSRSLSPLAFVNFLQNHDQIGNRALGDRLEWSASALAIEAALAITLLAPQPPMLFMGEEWGARTPFPFFCDFSGDLADAIRQGRRREFAEAYETFGSEVPDPLDKSTFESAKLNWSEKERDGKERHRLVKALLAVRQREIIPHLANATFSAAELVGDVLEANWVLADARKLSLIANLSDRPATRSHAMPLGRAIWGGSVPVRLPPWSVFWSIGAP